MLHFPTYKQRGEWVELKFMMEASERGFRVMQPQGQMAPYDVAVERGGRFLRVQVKSTTRRHRGSGGFRAATRRALSKTYKACEIDLMAVYVIPCKTWYLIPGKLVAGRESVSLDPEGECHWRRGAQFEHFRDAWHLLDAA